MNDGSSTVERATISHTRIAAVALLFVVSLTATAQSPDPEEPSCFDPQGYRHATQTILCDCGCHPQSVHDCACGRASEMRGEIRKVMIDEGCLSGEDVVALYVERYGEQIRVAPTATGFNLVAWVGPLVAFAGTSVLLLLLIRRWSRGRVDGDGDTPPPAPTAADAPYEERLREALEKME